MMEKPTRCGDPHERTREPLDRSTALQAACSAMDDRYATGDPIAIVDGALLREGHVTAFVDAFRWAAGLREDGAWAAWLWKTDGTEALVRQETIVYLINFMVMRGAAEELGIEVPYCDVQAQIAYARSAAGGDEGLQAQLASLGVDLDQYEEGVRMCFVQTRLIDQTTEVEPPSASDILQFLKSHELVDRSAVLSDIPEDAQVAARTYLYAAAKEKAFDDWLAAYRTSIDIARLK